VIPQRYLAIAKTKSQQLYDLKLSDNPLILVAEAPEARKQVHYCTQQMQLILMP
jgi:hypothetical protein